jgi:hypothetical protein
MSVLDDLGLYLQENGFGQLGSTIFLGVLPSEPVSYLALTEEYGYDVYYTLEEVQMRYEEPRLIVWSKNPRYEVARSIAQDVYKLFGAIHNQTINGIRYLSCKPEHPPYFNEIDPQRNVFIIFYMEVCKDVE